MDILNSIYFVSSFANYIRVLCSVNEYYCLILLIKKLDILAGPLFVAEYSIFRRFREKDMLSSYTNLYITNVCNFLLRNSCYCLYTSIKLLGNS